MRSRRFIRAAFGVAFAAAAARCSSSSPVTPTSSSAPPAAVTSFISSVQASDGTTGTQQGGSPPAANGGPAVTPTASSTIVNGNTDVVQLQGGAPFQTVYVTVPNTSGITAVVNGHVTTLAAASGYFQLQLSAPTTNVLLLLKLAPTIQNGTTFTLAYSVATPTGAVGPPASLTKTAAGAGCTFNVGPVNLVLGPAATTGSIAVNVTAGTNCAWTATTNAPFLTITQGATGTGGGVVQFSITANTGAARTASLIVAGIPVTITQPAGSTTSVALAAPTPNSPIGGVTLARDVLRPALVVNNAVASGGDAGTVTYRFEISDLSSFPADPARTFTADNIAQGAGTTGWVVTRDLGPSVTWYWHARATNGAVTSPYSATESFKTPDPLCAFSVTPTSINAVAAGQGAPIAITRTSGTCSWSAAPDVGWITGPSGAAAGGTFTFNIAENSGAASSRTGHITISWADGSATVTVAQAAATQCAFTLTNPSNGTSQLGVFLTGGTFPVALSASPASCDWSLSVDSSTPPGMLTFAPPSGTGNATISLSVSSTNADRTGTLRVTAGPGKLGSATFTVIESRVFGLLDRPQRLPSAAARSIAADQ